MNRYITNNFEIEYPKYNTLEVNPLYEVYLSNMYNNFKEEYLKLLEKGNVKINKKEENRNRAISLDVLSYLVMKNYQNENPFFSKKPKYDYNDIKSIVENFLNNKEKEEFKKILIKLEKLSKEYYLKCNEMRDKIFKIKYQIIQEDLENIKLDLIVQDKKYDKIIDGKTIVVKKSIYLHLIKMYNLTNYQNFESNIPLDNLFNDRVFILYYRYFAFDNGNNQSSILPSFKKLLKKYLNIKIELFGSAINTSNRFGSLFYDIEKYFGSMGDFFQMNIIKGYYELNPPYEDNIINNVFLKLSNSLTNNKNPLLFFLILPKRDYQQFTNFKILSPWIKRMELIPKEKFPFLRYDRKLLKSKVDPIVDVIFIIVHNEFIDDFYKMIIKNWDNYFNKWIKE